MSNTSRFSIHLALNAFNIPLTIELSEQENRDLVNDSRQVKAGDVFAATLGHLTDGRDYIEQAIKAGAELILVQCDEVNLHGKIELRKVETTDSNNHKSKRTVTLVQFFELHKNLSRLASLYYLQAHNKLTTVGITGTNGKTTTSQIIAQLFESCGKSCAVIGTVGAGKLDALTPIVNTTPGPTELNKLLNDFVNDDISHVAMEISSHALDQHRVSPSILDIAVFTNLSRDHLDYHETMEKYASAKEQIFTKDTAQIAVLNGDDICAQSWLKSWTTDSNVFVYGLTEAVKEHKCFVYANNIKHTSQGVEFSLETFAGHIDISCVLMGDFNVSNLLASIAVLLSQGYSLEKISKAISELKPIIGRMEVISAANVPTSVIDYAHTPDALESALKACQLHCEGELYVVFGCGGDRDNGKRSLMGAVAEQYADHVVITNDNPRNESPTDIANEILQGCKFPEKAKVILTRSEAVENTIEMATAKDMILFAGKGHEDYIVVGNEKLAYNEREFVQSIYAKKAML
ncbi:UDP-N-acetylmuramoyl-L-alanyl-D-glutamate--2,6-diaminopimelate ligase [Pseudocolwellia sp. AS88]|uniref:UDP-N-acetylmuramoyl-L-alanyl-D-glutamate--2, 6-diaminopimelate ligase n=1 Tax=Pseudocolwellia sp. AS88 TaxID=3063958 RepID=UPI0026EED926|nr:UDP-N-acetylmuramoyl-L-alanyl-D-glutamate--2,6-diaminopimelate ligase [Pseudocolwellia sp. AS88]MDO7084989.1 UDP-N-acetylmuramoyl-L-alanyl-D-glutamate--2,6-diaminopimelate ligase [Pseudocolwellia sp. AS88]